MAENRAFSVSEVNEYIKEMLDGDINLRSIYVRGELSNFKTYPSGHLYFTLKDAEGTLKSVMFKGSASKLRFKPENGMKVVAFGRVTVYPRDGVYQLYVSEMTPDGVGDLHLAFEQLKEKLGCEGLFDPRYKKPIPVYPDRIAIITSPAGAAVRDMLRILGARYPLSTVILMGVRVQGAEAPPEIVGAIRYANRHKVADVIITGRGGGSIEDLWAFNDERVARAIFESEIPIISAVGHEPDVTIADYVADLRAATPSNAAELAVPDKNELFQQLDSAQARMTQAAAGRLNAARRALQNYAARRVMTSPENYIADRRAVLGYITASLASAVSAKTAVKRRRFAALAAGLDAMSPLKVLARGYSVATDAEGRAVKSARGLETGMKMNIRLTDGTAVTEIQEVQYGSGKNQL